MTERFRCTSCGAWFTPDEFDDEEEDLCPTCQNPEPITREDRLDAAADDLFHSMREDGEL